MGAEIRPSPVAPALAPDAAPRLGLLTLATDLVVEGDARRLLPGDVGVHVTRVAFENPTTPDNLRRMAPRLAAAADLLVPGLPLAAIGYACTAASVAIGDAEVAATIAGARPGVPVVTPAGAACAGLAALGARRIALLTPYLPETTAPMARFFEREGVQVVTAHCLGLADDRDIARLAPGTIRAAAAAADAPGVDALFLSCTNLRALGEIAGLEARLGKPVLCSNQALLWRLLHHAGRAPAPGAWGRLFDVTPLERAA